MTNWLNWEPPDAPGPAATVQMAPPPPPPPPPSSGSTTAGGRAAMAVALVIAVLVGFLGVSVVINRNNTDTANRSDGSGVTAPSFVPERPATTPTPSTVLPTDTAAIAAKVVDATVDITTTVGYGNGQAAGTGMVIASSGEILTNNHVIAGATAITVQVNGAGPTYTAKVLGTDRTDDIAVLKIDGAPNLKAVKAGNSSALALGDPVVALGNSQGRGGPLTVRSGAVSGLDQTATASDPSTGTSETLSGLIQTTAPLQPGDSGGPLINTAGQVIGMNTAASLRNRFNGTTALSFAIPISKAMSVAGDIRAGRSSATIQVGQPGFIGVQVSPSLVVTRVVPGMPAEGAGMQAGDRIVSIEGKPLTTSNSLTEALNLHRTGETISVTWVGQDGQTHNGKLKLVAAPPD